MVTVKLFGGAKKSFSNDVIIVEKNNLTIQELLDFLILQKPKETPTLDFNNVLIAVNGIESSALEGKSTKLEYNDTVSIIPIIHGGGQRIQLKICRSITELFVVKANNNTIKFLENLRKDFPKLVVQALSSKYILNKTHAKKIITLSLIAKKNNILLSKKLETDLLLRFAGTTQISQAIEKVGVKSKQDFIIIAIGKKRDLNLLYDTLKPYLRKKLPQKNYSFLKIQFKISNEQINSILSKTPLEDLLAEKAAILF